MPNNSLYDGIIAPQGGLYQPGPPVMLPPNGGGLAALSGGMDKVDTSSPLQYGMLQDQFGLTDSGGASPFNGGNVPGPNGYTVASKDQSRLGSGSSGNLFAYGDDGGNAGSNAIANILINGGASVPLPRARPDPNSDLVYEPALVNQARPTGDIWSGLRSPEENVNGVAPRAGMITGARPAAMPVRGLAAIQPPQQQAAPRPITYSAVPVAAGNFAAGSPNASFEKQNGMGSVTNSMASSSRWNTGY